MFTILEKSQHPLIRANTIIALGDLNFRFPNLLEPWTPNLYGRSAVINFLAKILIACNEVVTELTG